MTSEKFEHFSPGDPPTASSSNPNTFEASEKSSESLQLVGDMTFSKIKRGRDLLMINGSSYKLNKENKLHYYWRCETRSCNATLITTKCLITNKHSIYSTGKNDHNHDPSITEQEIRVFREHVKQRALEELTPIIVLAEEEMRKLNLSKEAQQLLPIPDHMSNL